MYTAFNSYKKFLRTYWINVFILNEKETLKNGMLTLKYIRLNETKHNTITRSLGH